MALTLDNGATPVVYTDPPDGFCATVGKYWTRKPVKGELYGVERVGAPATAGKVLKRHDFVGRDVGPLIVWYINTSEQLVMNAYDADAGQILNKVLTVTIPNYKQLVACNVESFDPISGAPKKSGTNLYRMACAIVIRQDRNA